MSFTTNTWKEKFNANLLFTDADSLVYEIEPDDVYQDLYEKKSLFDFSDWSCQKKINW